MVTTGVGELLLIKRPLYAIKFPYKDRQKEQIFNSRCTIGGKVYELIIDGWSCTNVAFKALIDKLQLPTEVQPIPYTLQ